MSTDRFSWSPGDLVPVQRRRRTVRVAPGAAAEFACQSKACAPPPVGSGGSTGGTGGGGGFRVRGGLDNTPETKEFLRRAYNFVDPVTGWASRITLMSVQPGVARVDGEVVVFDDPSRTGPYDKRTVIGSFTRTVVDDGTSAHVEHALFALEPHAQGAGFGARFNANSEQAYREAGVNSVRLTASLDVGGYAWARQGYVMDKTVMWHTVQLDRLKKRVEQETTGATPEETEAMSATREKMLDLLDRNDMAGLAAMPQGKNVLLGSKWHAVKELV